MSKCYFQNAADRPICYECPFKTVSRCSDLTIFDGWHASKYIPTLKDDDRGYTIILIQSDKGRDYIDRCGCLELYKINTDQAISLDGKMALKSVKRPDCRDAFYDLLDENGIEETVKILFPVTLTDRIIEKGKLFLDKIGVLQAVNRIKSR